MIKVLQFGSGPQSLGLKGNSLSFSEFTATAFQNMNNVLFAVSALQWVIAAAIILAALLIASCVAQGALVYAIGTEHVGPKFELKRSLSIGARAFWPIAALNAIILLSIAVFRLLANLPVALTYGTALSYALYVVAFVLFAVLTFALAIIQIFALNAMVLQGTSVADGLIRGYDLFKKHWLVTIETAGILMLLAIFGFVAFNYAIIIAQFPLMLFVLLAGVMQSSLLFYGGMFIGLAVLILAHLAFISFMAQLQYATWTHLYHRLGEGGVVPKLHRLIRSLTGRFSVPKN
ncbi:MAG: hypothetical protein RDU25_01290 [Patescibacteria group bacterium]|nr:hypothetical protein [Patescibacteria group bacterium]